MLANCPACHSPVPDRDIDALVGIADCRFCGHEFPVNEEGRPVVSWTEVEPPMPDGVVVEEMPAHEGTYRAAPQPRELRVTSRLRRRRGLGVGDVLTMAFGGAAVWSVVRDIRDHGMLDSDTIAFALLGAAVTYLNAVHFFNRCRFRIEGSRLSVTNGPLPWFGHRSVTLAAEEIRQLYVRKVTGKRSRHYELWAATEDGRHVRLVPWFDNRQQAQYLEWRIERHLGIVDDPSMNDR